MVVKGLRVRTSDGVKRLEAPLEMASTVAELVAAIEAATEGKVSFPQP